jgi:hypothetical protein
MHARCLQVVVLGAAGYSVPGLMQLSNCHSDNPSVQPDWFAELHGDSPCFWVYLLELLLVRGNGLGIFVKDEHPGALSALVDRCNALHCCSKGLNGPYGLLLYMFTCQCQESAE